MKARIGAIMCILALAACLGLPNAFAAPADGATQWHFGMQPPVTDMAERMQNFNDLLLVIIIAIVIFVFFLLAWVIFRYREKANPVPSKVSHHTLIEVLWTIVPILILVVIAIQSFQLLYAQYDFPKADVTIKATGKMPWSWSYEYVDNKFSIDSIMIEDKDINPEKGQLRKLSVDNEMVVPVNKVVQVLITSDNVIHQWTVPAFGSRADAIPGRLNRTWFKAKQTGIFYGQCSALCGRGHSTMPIAVRVVSEDDYNKWVASQTKSTNADSHQVASARTGQAAQ